MKLPAKQRLLLLLPLVLLIVAAVLVWWGKSQRASTEHYYSGTIEATQANLAFQTAGYVARVLVDEGQSVKTGQTLATLDKAPFTAAYQQAEANLTRAQATLEASEAGLALKRKTLPVEVNRARAAVESIRYAYEELAEGYRPQEVAKARLAVAEAESALAKIQRDKQRTDRLFEDKIVAASDKDTQDLRYRSAVLQHQQALENLKIAEEGFRKEVVASARARLVESEALLALAQSNLEQIEVAEGEVTAARAQVAVAAAALDTARIQLSYCALRAPFDGILSSRNVEPGEVVTIGREVLSVVDLSQVDLKIFVNETDIGTVKPNQAATVRIDTFSDKTYEGRVSYISPQAEFTPKIIQTHKERVKLVYLVKISVDNPHFELKPGMPADAWLH